MSDGTGTRKLKLSDVIQRRKLILKRMKAASERASQYAIKPSNMISEFGTVEEQRKAVEGTWQSVEDLAKEYLALSRALAAKNAEVKVETSKGVFTAADLIVMKQTLGKLVMGPLAACHSEAMSTRRSQRLGTADVTLEPMFDEKARFRRQTGWETFLSEINGKLDDINTNNEVDVPPAVELAT